MLQRQSARIAHVILCRIDDRIGSGCIHIHNAGIGHRHFGISKVIGFDIFQIIEDFAGRNRLRRANYTGRCINMVLPRIIGIGIIGIPAIARVTTLNLDCEFRQTGHTAYIISISIGQDFDLGSATTKGIDELGIGSVEANTTVGSSTPQQIECTNLK